MFFRRAKPQEWTLDNRLTDLKKLGFETGRDKNGKNIVTRNGCAATLDDGGDGNITIGKAGILVGGEIAHLVNGGYQMFLRTPSGKELPALSTQLTALHAFDEDLREGLGLKSLYNLSLGTTSDDHLYDRVVDRDAKQHPHPWEKRLARF